MTATDYTVRSVTYTVPSSHPGVTYTVTCDPATGRPLTCTCPDFTHRGHQRACKHLRLVSQKDHGGIKPHVNIVVGGPARRDTSLVDSLYAK